MTNLDWEGPAIVGKELKGPLGWVEVATPEGCGGGIAIGNWPSLKGGLCCIVKMG